MTADDLLLQADTVGALLTAARNALGKSVDPAAAGTGAGAERASEIALEAALLLEEAAGISRAQAMAFPERELPAAAVAQFAALLHRRMAGEPVAYILGSRGFHAIELSVDSRVLIPRPETELLVNGVLERAGADFSLVDIGTGSGAIALAIAAARPRARILGTDASAGALEVAAANAARLHLACQWVVSDGWASVQGEFDFIVSNPPYIRSADPHLDALGFEPRLALDGGPDGLAAIRWLLAGATPHLSEGGWVLIEHGYDQADLVGQLAAAHGLQVQQVLPDLAGHARVSVLQRTNARATVRPCEGADERH